MLSKTQLNKVQRFKSFVYGTVSIKLVDDEDALVIDLVARRNSRPVCPECGKGGPMYDRQPERLFKYLPFWTFKVLSYLWEQQKGSSYPPGVFPLSKHGISGRAG